MRITASMLDAMLAAGATAETIVAVVKADLLEDDAKRQKNTERMRRVRAHERTDAHTSAQTRTDPATAPQLVPPENPDATNCVDASDPPFLPPVDEHQKEKSPHTPLKEKLFLSKKDSQLKQEVEEERKKESEVVNTRARAKRIACRLPPDFELTEVRREFCLTLLPADRIRTEFDKFCDHWTASSGANAVKRNWDAAWRNWCRRAVERGPPINGHHHQPRPGSREDRQERTSNAIQKLTDFIAAGSDERRASGNAGQAPDGLISIAKPP